MTPTEKITSALRRLHLSDNEQSVYLSLVSEGEASARTLASRTGITRPSVYDQLKSLRHKGLVHELDRDGKAQFAAADLKHLEALLDDQIDRLEQSRDFLKTALPSLSDTLKTIDPKVRFFEGEEGVKQLLKDLMWHDNETLYIIWATEHIESVYEPTFLKWFDERRSKRNLSVRALVTESSEYFREKSDTQKRLLTKQDSHMASIIYGSKVAYISSNAEAFGFIVESKEHTELQKILFDSLWKQVK